MALIVIEYGIHGFFWSLFVLQTFLYSFVAVAVAVVRIRNQPNFAKLKK